MFQKPEKTRTNKKVCVWGGDGVGKTLFALQADQVALIDVDQNSDEYIHHFKFEWSQPKSFTELEQSVSFLARQQHNFKTVVVDSATVAWGMIMQEMIEPNVKPDWITIKGRWKAFLRSLAFLEMDIILTARWRDAKLDGGMWYEKTGGKEPDVENNTLYEMDYVLFLWKTLDENNHPHFMSRIEHTRDLIGVAPAGKTFEGLTFSRFKALFPDNPQSETQSEKNGLSIQTLQKALGEQLRKQGMKTQAVSIPYCSQILGKSFKNFEDLNKEDIQAILLGMHQAALAA